MPNIELGKAERKLDNLIEIRDVSKFFKERKGIRQFFSSSPAKPIRAVDGVSLSIDRGKILVIAGESGSGKTTLARIIMRAIDADKGSITFEGKDITNFKGVDLREFRSKVQMVMQDPYTSINPGMKVIDIVKEPLTVHYKRSTSQEQIEKVYDALRNVKLEPINDIANKYPHMLSGGQRQRVALARSIVTRPRLIVADEPVSMLDVSVRADILDLMRNLKNEFNISFIYITHDLATAGYVGDDIIIMYSGRVVESGSINQVLANPLHPYTQALIDAISEPDPDNLKKDKNIRIKKIETSTGAAEKGCKFFQRCPYSMEICKIEPGLVEQESGHKVSCFIYPQT